MVRLIESGKIKGAVFARSELGEDILRALYGICRGKDIRTDVILDSSGSVANFTYQRFPISPKLCPTNVPIGTMHGEYEISLQGTIGTTVCNLVRGSAPDTAVERMFPTVLELWEGPVDKWPMVGCEYGPGTPCIHAHYVANSADYTVCGHLMPGTRVAPGDPSKPSHFTVIIAEINNMELQATIGHKIGFHQNLVRVDE